MVATLLDKSPVTAEGIEVFRAGLQTDSEGHTKVWTIPELDEIVEAYNDATSAHHKAPAIPAPIQIGHEDPVFQEHGSYGWIEKAYRQGDTVLVDYTKVDPQFAEMVNQGKYLHRSVSFYPREHPGNPTPGRLNIRHVAYVRYPAIKGLADKHSFKQGGNSFSEFTEPSGYYNFSFPSQETLDFASVGVSVFNALGAIANLMARQRERVIELEGLERANEDFPEELIDMIRSEAAKPPETQKFAPVASLDALFEQVGHLSAQVSGLTNVVYSLVNQSSEASEDNYPQYTESTVPNQDSASIPPAVEQQFQELQSQIHGLKSELNLSQSRVRELENLNLRRERQSELEGVANFVESAIGNRQILPTDKATTINFIMKLSNNAADGFEFSEGDITTKKSPRQVYLDEITKRPPLWNDNPMPSSTETGYNFFSEADLAQKAQTLQKEYREKGVHKPLAECIDLVESGRLTA